MAASLIGFLIATSLLASVSGSAFALTPETPPPTAAIAESPAAAALGPVNAAIRDMLDDPKNGGFLQEGDLTGLRNFYEVRNYAPVWSAERKLTARAKAILERIALADSDGLDGSSYVLPPFGIGEDGRVSPLSIAQVELLTSQAILAYTRDASAGRVDPAKLSKNFGYERTLPDRMQVLTAMIVAADAVPMLESYNPPHPEFAALRDKLAELRAAKTKAEPPILVPSGPSLKPGMADGRVVIVRQRLGLSSESLTSDIYDEAVVAAVKDFQKSAGLKGDGILGPASLAALNKAPKDPIPLILANMERWRWLPRDLGHMQVRVNIPDFSLTVMRDGDVIHTTRIVVGKPSQKTPIFSDNIAHIVVNPSWNVPASIARNEMLPAAQRNPGSLRGYEVLARIGGKFRVVDPWAINWNRVDMRHIQFRQPPGEQNALGSIKFLFPNHYSVYLHDTPSKSLFEREERAFSHGCVRVMNPMVFAEALLAEEPDLDAAKLQKMRGSKERWVKLANPVPVHLVYFTAWIDESGELQTRKDLYGYDASVEEALGIPHQTL